MQRLLINSRIIHNVPLHLPEDIRHYLLNVIKIQNNEFIIVFNQQYGEWKAKINRNVYNDIVVVPYELLNRNIIKPLNLVLAFCLVKNSHNKFIIEKATELNVSEIQPLVSHRSIVRSLNLRKMYKISTEATEQCGRIHEPLIHNPMSIESLIYNNQNNTIFICNTQLKGSSIYDINFSIIKDKKIVIIIGPEGGYSNNEIEIIKLSKQVFNISLGDTILRSETAVIVALSSFQFILRKC